MKTLPVPDVITCPDCHGTGYEHNTPCLACDGHGVITIHNKPNPLEPSFLFICIFLGAVVALILVGMTR